MSSDTSPKSVPYPQEVAEACARITSEIGDALRDIPRVARAVEDDPHAHDVRVDVLAARLAEMDTSEIPRHRLIVYLKDGYVELPSDWRSGLLRVTAITDAKRITSGCALRMLGTVTLVQTEWRDHPADAGDTGWHEDDHELRCFTQDFWIRPIPLPYSAHGQPAVWQGVPVAIAVEPRIPLVVIDFYPTAAIVSALRWHRVVTRDEEGGKILQVLRDVDTLTAVHGGTPGSGLRGIAQRALGEFWARDLARGAAPEKYVAAGRLATLLADRANWHVDDEVLVDAAIIKLTGNAWWGAGHGIYTLPNAASDANNEALRQIDRKRCGIPEGRPKIVDLRPRKPAAPAPGPAPTHSAPMAAPPTPTVRVSLMKDLGMHLAVITICANGVVYTSKGALCSSESRARQSAVARLQWLTWTGAGLVPPEDKSLPWVPVQPNPRSIAGLPEAILAAWEALEQVTTSEPERALPTIDCQIEASPEGVSSRAVIAVTSGAPHATTRVTYGPWCDTVLAARQTVNARLFEILGTSGEDVRGWTPWHPAPPNRLAVGMTTAVHRAIGVWSAETNRLAEAGPERPATRGTLDVTLTVEKRDRSAFEPGAMPEWRGGALFIMRPADPSGTETVIGGAEGPWRDSEARAVRSFATLNDTFLRPTKVPLGDAWTFHLSGAVPTSDEMVAAVTRALEDLPKKDQEILASIDGLTSQPEDSVLLRSLDHTVQGVACAATHAATARLTVPDWKKEPPIVLGAPDPTSVTAFFDGLQQGIAGGDSVADVLDIPPDPVPVDTSCWPSDGSLWAYTHSSRDIRQPVHLKIAVVEWARSGAGWHIQDSLPYQSEDDGNPPSTGKITSRYTSYIPEKVVLPRMASRWRNRDTGVEGAVVYNDAGTAWCLRGKDGVRLTLWTWGVGDTFREEWSEVHQDPDWVGAADEIIHGTHFIHDSIVVDVGTGDAALPAVQAIMSMPIDLSAVLADMSPIEMGPLPPHPEDAWSKLAREFKTSPAQPPYVASTVTGRISGVLAGTVTGRLTSEAPPLGDEERRDLAESLRDLPTAEPAPELPAPELPATPDQELPFTVTEMHWFRSKDSRRWSLRVPAETPGETWRVIARIDDHPADARIEWWATLPEAATRGNLDRNRTPPQQSGVRIDPVIVRARGFIEFIIGKSPTLVVDRFGSPVTFGARKG